MKTQQELMQAYWGTGGTVDMVKEYNAKHGCNVKPWECVKETVTGNVYCHDPAFVNNPEAYTFALTILYDDKLKEHRPVFVGDKIYGTITGGEYLSRDIHPNCWEFMSWNPPKPKRTFKIELTEDEVMLLVDVTQNYFNTNIASVHNKLTAARDKE